VEEEQRKSGKQASSLRSSCEEERLRVISREEERLRGQSLLMPAGA
jgi:hypothetical protein